MKEKYSMSEIEILHREGCTEDVIKHCIMVSKKALEIADRIEIPLNKDLIRRGALLHDLGRCEAHDITHGVKGAKIAEKLGISRDVINIIERHVGAGITAKEAAKAGLPRKDYLPVTLEEKIVSYADNLTLESRTISFEESLDKFNKILGKGHPAIKRMEDLHNEIQSLYCTNVYVCTNGT